MSNLNVGSGAPLQSPSQLWNRKQAAPPQPVAQQPAQPVSQPQTQQSPPRQLLPSLPPMGQAMTLLSFNGNQAAGQQSTQQAGAQQSGGTTLPSLPRLSNTPAAGSSSYQTTGVGGAQQPPRSGLSGQFGQLRSLIKSADDRLLDYYNVKLVKNDKGQITGYLLNGQNVTAQDIQRHLLPQSGILHQQINDLKKEIDQTYQNFQAQVQLQFPALAPAEQTSVQIQMQAVQVVYESFANRLSQVDSLIK